MLCFNAAATDTDEPATWPLYKVIAGIKLMQIVSPQIEN